MESKEVNNLIKVFNEKIGTKGICLKCLANNDGYLPKTEMKNLAWSIKIDEERGFVGFCLEHYIQIEKKRNARFNFR